MEGTGKLPRGGAIQLTVVEALIRLGLAVLVGMAIGLEREWHEKAAGFRTITLVTAGSALFAMAAVGFSPTDNARIAAGLATGIGFLGAGTILREQGEVVGLTTAATVWAACALGIGSAFGEYVLVVAGTAVVLLVLIGFRRLDIAETAQEVRRYAVSAAFGVSAADTFAARFEQAGLRARRKSITRDGAEMTVVWEVFGSPERHAEATRAFLDDPGVSKVEVL